MLSAQSQQMYGTVQDEPQVETRRRSKVAVALTAAALLAVGVVAMTAGTKSAHLLSATNMNLDFTSVYGNSNKEGLAKVSPLVTEVGLKVLNVTVYNQRWAIFGFDRAEEEIVPLMTGQATFDWEKDFRLFKNALPEDAAVLAVYNFQYWVSEQEIESDPIMITWCPKALPPEKVATAGYYLGAEILALNALDEGRINTERIITGKKGAVHGGPLARANMNDAIGKAKGQGFADPPERLGFSGPYRMESISETYSDFCENEMMVPPEYCALDNHFHDCPFDKADSEKCQNDSERCGLFEPDGTESQSPCDLPVCAGAEFGKPFDARPEIPQACCDYIFKEFCAVQRPDGMKGLGFGHPGCHHVTLSALKHLCEGAEPVDTLHLGDLSYEAFGNCDDRCYQSCVFFDDPTDTYKMCDGCPVDGDYQCHPGDEANSIQPAYGYMTGMCCGFNPKCGEKDGSGKPIFADDDSCATQEYNNCIWMEQTHCLDEQRRQEIEVSAKGCCVIKNADDAFGTTWEYIDSRAVFCGVRDTEYHSEIDVAVDADGNPVDASLVEFHEADAAVDQTGGNVCHLLQEEAATKQANFDEHERVLALPTTPAPEEAPAKRRV